MDLRHIIVFFILVVGLEARAYELITIQAVADGKRTFVTRHGKRQGISPGMTGTFTAEDISILAKALTVTGNFTQWQVINPAAHIPFEKGTLVTYYPATEYIWALAPEEIRQKYIKRQILVPRRSWVFKGALSRGLTESVSDAPVSYPQRGGFAGEVYYEKDFYQNFAFDAGLRYEREVINYEGGTLRTLRNMAIVDVIYYFNSLRDLLSGGRLYLSAGMGYGLSNTSTIGLSQSGTVRLLPGVKAGISLPFDETYEFLLDGAFESMNTTEELQDGSEQGTTQTNFKVGFGLRRFF
ncbi:MAG TPA: hypothetical protein VNJ01_08075 [Bacteriovoracaceae bacterium]|nr:hypothetical protein [Bacteriovoracaceae bacterium]